MNKTAQNLGKTRYAPGKVTKMDNFFNDLNFFLSLNNIFM